MRKLAVCCGAGVAAVLLAACAASRVSSPVTPPALSLSASGPAVNSVVRAWNRSLTSVPLPDNGCFEASYPAIAWSRVECAQSAHLPTPRRPRSTPATIGIKRDYALSVSPRYILEAYGSFPKISGVKSVKTVPVPSTGGSCVCGDDAYMLQLNSNVYPLAPCGSNAHCNGWEQVLVANPNQTGGKVSHVFIQDWLISTNKKPLKCPAAKTGWGSAYGDCYFSSNTIAFPKMQVTDLENVSVSLSASPSGDSAFITVGTKVYGMKNMQADLMRLSQNWTAAEFNIFGDCCGSLVTFNTGSTVLVNVEANYGSSAAPDCKANGGTTGETNSLSLIATPSSSVRAQYPSILFAESNVAGGGSPSCDALAGL